jgi:hypothetical protein
MVFGRPEIYQNQVWFACYGTAPSSHFSFDPTDGGRQAGEVQDAGIGQRR